MAYTELSPVQLPIHSEDALHAWDVANFPLLQPDSDNPYIIVDAREGHLGRAGMLSRDLFVPSPLLYPKSGSVRFLAVKAREKWQKSHAAAVLESNIMYGDRIATHVLTELAVVSIGLHKATEIWTAANTFVQNDKPHETLFSFWDNGKGYTNPQELEESFSRDSTVSLTTEDKLMPNDDTFGAAPAFVVHEVTRVFGGTLSVLSGGNRIDITEQDDVYNFEHSKTTGILGNLVIARFPHREKSEI